MANLKDFLKEAEYYYLEFYKDNHIKMNRKNKYAVAYAAAKLKLKGRRNSDNLYQVIREMRRK